jgi:hypothetical protein
MTQFPNAQKLRRTLSCRGNGFERFGVVRFEEGGERLENFLFFVR